MQMLVHSRAFTCKYTLCVVTIFTVAFVCFCRVPPIASVAYGRLVCACTRKLNTAITAKVCQSVSLTSTLVYTIIAVVSERGFCSSPLFFLASYVRASRTKLQPASHATSYVAATCVAVQSS